MPVQFSYVVLYAPSIILNIRCYKWLLSGPGTGSRSGQPRRVSLSLACFTDSWFQTVGAAAKNEWNTKWRSAAHSRNSSVDKLLNKAFRKCEREPYPILNTKLFGKICQKCYDIFIIMCASTYAICSKVDFCSKIKYNYTKNRRWHITTLQGIKNTKIYRS